MANETQDNNEQAKGMVARHPVRFGAASIATAFGLAGYVLGHKRAESQSLYSKFKREISNL